MFKENVINSFSKIKKDMNRVKKNVTGWLVYLNKSQENMDTEIMTLRRRVERLEEQITAKSY